MLNQRRLDTGLLIAPLGRLLGVLSLPMGVLSLPMDDDVLDLAIRLQHTTADGDIVLEVGEAAVLERLARQWNQMLTSGDPAAEWTWTGRSTCYR